MSFRARLMAAAALAALLPLAVFALGARQEAGRRLGAEAERRARARAEAVRADLRRETASVRGRLEAAADRAADDPSVRRALVAGDPEREGLLDWAGTAMRAAGLDALELLGPDGRILSSGHFRNEWGRRDRGLGEALAAVDGPALVRLRRAEGPFLVLAAGVPLRVGGRLHHLVGGVSLEERLLPRMNRAGPAEVRLAAAPATGVRPTADAAVRIDVPLLSPGPDGAERSEAALEVRPAGLPLADLRRGLGRWFLLTAAGSLAAALLAAWWLARRTSRPLEELAARARAVDLDRPEVSFPTDRDDEVGELARTLDAMADRLRRDAARLRDAERRAALGDLARQVNHDVRNALTPIRNVLAHLEEAVAATGGEAARVLEERGGTLEAGLAYLEELAGRYRDLSTRPEPRPCDAGEAVRRATSGLDDGGRLRVEVADGLPAAWAEPVALRRIVENLARNALQAVGPGGRVRVSVAEDPGDGAGADVVGQTEETPVRGVRIEVEDDGPGMDEEALERAFEPFHTTREEGTGLGLAIVRRLVHDLDGELRVDSEPGRGTRFAVVLPAADGPGSGTGGTEDGSTERAAGGHG